MRACMLTHLSDAILARDLRTAASGERASTAVLLAHIAEFDARRLYLPAGYPSMYAYCVENLGLSEDSALKRIQAARVAREFPAILPALADGRVHLSAVLLLAPHLGPENAGDLLAAAAHRTKAQVAALLAERFPRSELLPMVVALPAGTARDQHAPGHVGDTCPPATTTTCGGELAPGPVASRAKLAPVAPERYALQVTIGRDTYEKLRHAEALLSHAIPAGDLAAVLDRLIDLGVAQLEKRRFCAARRPRPRRRRGSANPRHIPAHVKRVVWERDGGQCTYVSAAGHRCAARRFLQFDHVDPVARGGQATVAGLRLRCRAHNQFEAERTFGAGFMSAKRAGARRTAAAQRLARAAAEEQSSDVTSCLRTLGFRAGEARRAAAYCATLPDATLEDRVRTALSFLCPKAGGRVGTTLGAGT